MVQEIAVVLTDETAVRIAASSSSWGPLALCASEADDLVGVVGAGEADGAIYSVSRDTLRGHVLAAAWVHPGSGAWYRAQPGLHDVHSWALRLRTPVPVEVLTGALPSWRHLGPTATTLVVTHDPDGENRWAAWTVQGDAAVPHALTVLRHPRVDPLETFGPEWPLHLVRNLHVSLVGAGSIGSAAAHTLAMAGVGALTLVDDDRLQWHNLVRHRGSRLDVGRYKVDGLADDLGRRWPGTQTDPLRRNVISHADQMRPLFEASDLVLCCADGVDARRVVSHLSRRAGRPAVFACVLADGAVGEVLRFRPWPGHGCLLCQRADLTQRGVLDPEPTLDRRYGTGTRHLPMTAVGSDLALVGDLAAKVALATLLQVAGQHDQIIDGEHAVVGLRPTPDTQDGPAPFDARNATIAWSGPAPQRPYCPTCRP